MYMYVYVYVLDSVLTLAGIMFTRDYNQAFTA